MDYLKLLNMIPPSQRGKLSIRLVDFILKSKNDDRMTSSLANTILHNWRQDTLLAESGLAALLEASVLLEPSKTLNVLEELRLAEVAKALGQSLTGQEKG